MPPPSGHRGRARRWLDEHLGTVRQSGAPRRAARARRRGKLRIRVNAYSTRQLPRRQVRRVVRRLSTAPVISPRVRIGGVKIFADSAWTNEMFMTEPHTGWRPGPRRRLLGGRRAHRAGSLSYMTTVGRWPPIHVATPRTTWSSMPIEAALAGADGAAHRHRIEHVMAVRDDQLRRMRDLSSSRRSSSPGSRQTRRPMSPRPSDRIDLAWIGRWRDLLEAGVPAVASTDYPYDDLAAETGTSNGRAMKALSIAVTREHLRHRGGALASRDRRSPSSKACPLITRAGAYATFEEDHKGTSHAGKLADLVVLSDDPRSVAADQLADVKVLDDDRRRTRGIPRPGVHRTVVTRPPRLTQPQPRYRCGHDHHPRDRRRRLCRLRVGRPLPRRRPRRRRPR